MAMMDFVKSRLPGGGGNGHDSQEAQAVREEVSRDARDEEEERLHRILVEARDEEESPKKGPSMGKKVSGAVSGAMSGAGGALMGLVRKKKDEPSDQLAAQETTAEEEEAIRESGPAFGRGTVGVAEGIPEESFVRGRHEWERQREGPREAEFEYDEREFAREPEDYEHLRSRAMMALRATHPDDPAHAQAAEMIRAAEAQYASGEIAVATTMMKQAVSILEGCMEEARPDISSEIPSEGLRQSLGSGASRMEQLAKGQAARVHTAGAKGVGRAEGAVESFREGRRQASASTQAHVDQEVGIWRHYKARELVVKEDDLIISPADRKVLEEAVAQGVPLVGSKEVSVQTETKSGYPVTTKRTQAYAKSIAELKVDMRKTRIEESEYKKKVWDERVERMRLVAAMAGRLVEMGKVETKMGFPSPTGPAVPARVYAGGMMPSASMPAAQAVVGGMSKMRQVSTPRSPAASMVPVPQTRALSVLPTRRIRR